MLHLIIAIALVGLIVWLITAYIPMPAPFVTVIWAVCAICLIVYLMGALGIADIPVPRLH